MIRRSNSAKRRRNAPFDSRFIVRPLLWIAVSVALIVGAGPAQAKRKRSSHAVAEFKRIQPCPVTGDSLGPCPGWVIDHVQPLCAGGPDQPGNMQWQTVADAKVKDRAERETCKLRRKNGAS